jgi:hypothetical protein
MIHDILIQNSIPSTDFGIYINYKKLSLLLKYSTTGLRIHQYPNTL